MESKAFDIADKIIEKTYPNFHGKEKGYWGDKRISNYGILRGAIANALTSQEKELAEAKARLEKARKGFEKFENLFIDWWFNHQDNCYYFNLVMQNFESASDKAKQTKPLKRKRNETGTTS